MLPPHDRTTLIPEVLDQGRRNLNLQRLLLPAGFDRAAISRAHPCLNLFLLRSARCNGLRITVPPAPPTHGLPHSFREKGLRFPASLSPFRPIVFPDCVDFSAPVRDPPRLPTFLPAWSEIAQPLL